MNTKNIDTKYIDWLIKAKTKHSIGYALDHIYPNLYYGLLSDHYTKAQMVEFKNETLKEFGAQ